MCGDFWNLRSSSQSLLGTGKTRAGPKNQKKEMEKREEERERARDERLRLRRPGAKTKRKPATSEKVKNGKAKEKQ
jgi:hypothetical protein